MSGIAPPGGRLEYHSRVSAPASHTWTCSGCGRRVPLRVASCHCGLGRAQAAEASPRTRQPAGPPAPGWHGVWSSMPLDVKAIALASVLVVTGGVTWLLVAPPPANHTPALLGYLDQRPPAPRPASPPVPPFKLPWWK